MSALRALYQFGLALYSGTIFLDGDFEQTVPATFAGPLGVAAMPTFFHGPTQYLTALPLALAGSYEAAARILLVIYAALIVLTAFLCWRTMTVLDGRSVPLAPVLASTLAFPPVLDALVGREFEIVVLMAFAVMFWAAVHDRYALLGAGAAYVGLYKYVPLLVLPYLLARRWWRSVATFAVAAAVILALTYVLFGFDRFVNNNVPVKAAGLITGLASTGAFCHQVSLKDDGPDSDDTSIRSDVCRLSAASGIPAPLMYLAILAGTIAAFGAGMLRLERARVVLSPANERWRRIIELGLVTVVIAAYVYSHYYYLALLVLPLNALLARFLSETAVPRARMALWSVSYVLLGALREIPDSIYAGLIGVLILAGLLLDQYYRLPAASRSRDRVTNVSLLA